MSGRYLPLHLLGRGASGEVWCALDQQTGEEVAIKRLIHLEARDRTRFERELRALELVGGEGVVRLRDRWTEDGAPVLVLDLVRGKPFPGRPAPCTWEQLRPTALSLLRTLERVHRQGVVHRDLKPANVLVDESGRPYVLDFGLARGRALGSTITRSRAVVGTPRYLSPEQASGARVDARTDLFSVGVMLYEALTGLLPQEPAELHAMLAARAREALPSVARRRPDLPASVIALVDALLSHRPGDRPATAGEAADALEEGRAPVSGLDVPWLGSRAPIEDLVQAARAGRSLGAIGRPGSGRSRVLREAGTILGLRVLPAADRPWASLAALVPPGRPEAVERALRARLTAGEPVLVDDQADRWSRALLGRLTDVGPVLWAGPDPLFGGGALLLQPLRELDLEPLFADPELLLHGASDGAALLYRRSGGNPRRVVDELGAWVGLGQASWDGRRLHLPRPNLERLRTERAQPAPLADLAARALEPPLLDLLEWLALHAEGAELGLLSDLTGSEVWEVEAMIEALEAQGHLHRDPAGRLRAESAPRDHWGPDQRATAAAELAHRMPQGAPGRLDLLIAVDEPLAICEEAEHVAGVHLAHGRAAAAVGVLLQARDAVAADPPLRERLSTVLAKAALTDPTPAQLNAAIADLSAEGHPTLPLLHMARAARGRVLGAAETMNLASLDDPWLDSCRDALRLQSVQAEGMEPALALLRAVEVDRPTTDLSVRSRRSGWWGNLANARAEFSAAATFHREAARLAVDPIQRASALVRAARAELDDFAWDEAEEIAREAACLSADLRAPILEGYARSVIRAVAYRRDFSTEPDEALVAAAERLGDDDLLGLIALNEAAVQWRAGGPSGRIAAIAASAYTRRNRPDGTLLALFIGESHVPPFESHSGRLSETAPYRTRTRLQALGAWSRRDAFAARLWREEKAHLLNAVPPHHTDKRMDIFSVEELYS
jgi:hypothetical protein